MLGICLGLSCGICRARRPRILLLWLQQSPPRIGTYQSPPQRLYCYWDMAYTKSSGSGGSKKKPIPKKPMQKKGPKPIKTARHPAPKSKIRIKPMTAKQKAAYYNKQDMAKAAAAAAAVRTNALKPPGQVEQSDWQLGQDYMDKTVGSPYNWLDDALNKIGKLGKKLNPFD